MRSRSDGRGKISKPKTDASPPIPQTLFPLQSRSALKSVSVYGSPILLVMVTPQSFAACRCLPDRARRRASKQVLGRRGTERCMRNRLKFSTSGFLCTRRSQSWPLPGPSEAGGMRKTGSEQESVRPPYFAGFSVFAVFPAAILPDAGGGLAPAFVGLAGIWDRDCGACSVVRLSSARWEDVPICRSRLRPPFPWRVGIPFIEPAPAEVLSPKAG